MSNSATNCTNMSSTRLTAISIHGCIVKACFFFQNDNLIPITNQILLKENLYKNIFILNTIKLLMYVKVNKREH